MVTNKKKNGYMKAILLLSTPLLLLFMVIGFMEFNIFIRAKKAENYYQSLIDKNYSKAYDYVFLWDTNPKTKSSNYTRKEGREVYIHRMKDLEKEQGYRIIKASVRVIRNGRAEPIYTASLQLEINGKTIHTGETLEFVSGNKFWISNSLDANWLVRDGRMGIN